MKTNTLRDFLAVAERGSFRAAARQLGLTQPSLTRSIQELEKELGTTLFERHARGVLLSPMGERFMRRARTMRSEMRRAQDEFDQLRGNDQGQIRLALSSVAHMALLPQVVEAFRRRYPRVELDVLDVVLPHVESELVDGTVDLYIGPSHQDVPGELVVERLFGNERVVMARQDHPLARAQSLAELAGAEWGTTSITQRADDELAPVFAQFGLSAPRQVAQCHSALTFFFMLAHSDILMLLPVQWARSAPFRDQLHQIPIRERLYGLPICIICRKSMPLAPAAAYFCELVRQAAAGLEPVA